MVRTQIQLTEEQARRLRRVANDQGVSLAEFIRRCIDRALAEEAPGIDRAYARASALIGTLMLDDGAEDLAENHDRHLAETFD